MATQTDKEFFKSSGAATDASGLRSANDMTDAIPDQGWTASGSIPGVDNPGNEPINSAADSSVSFNGNSVPTPPYMTDMSGPADAEIPLNVLMSADEPMGPTTGAGLRSAVGEPVNFKVSPS